MADKFGNYIGAFLIAGGFGIIASIIPFFLLCVKLKSEEYADHNIELELDQIQDEEIAVDEYELSPEVSLRFRRLSTVEIVKGKHLSLWPWKSLFINYQFVRP